jgi:hypothetical protein
MKETDLINLRERIEAAKTKSSELRGQKDYLKRELLTGWGCASISEAEKELKCIAINIKNLDAQITKGLIELEDAIGTE